MWGNCVFVKECKEKNKFFKFACSKIYFGAIAPVTNLFTYSLIVLLTTKNLAASLLSRLAAFTPLLLVF